MSNFDLKLISAVKGKQVFKQLVVLPEGTALNALKNSI
jgi:hypothetical protein